MNSKTPLYVYLVASAFAAHAAAQTPSASFVRVDTSTRGDWKGVYGGDGYRVAGEESIALYATPVLTSESTWIWAQSTPDNRALVKPSNAADRIAATWYSYGSFLINTNITDQAPHQIALYCIDWDTMTRAETIDVLDGNGNVLDSQALLTSFNGGVYLVWNVTGNVTFRITRKSGNAVVSGIFFGNAAPAPASNANVSFSRLDATTQGNWRSAYGADGYSIARDQLRSPAYASPTVSGLSWTWMASTADVRALQNASGSDRIATTWYADGAFVMDTGIADLTPHQVALYCVDWDASRVQTIDVLDANDTLLDRQTLPNGFSNGVYLVWQVTGHVKFRIEASQGNAVVSGIFFGEASLAPVTIGVPPVNITAPLVPVPVAPVSTASVPPIPQLQTWEAHMVAGAALFCNQGEINNAIGSWGIGTEGNVWYYDGAKVYQQIAQYTNDPQWNRCADYSNQAYTQWVLAVAGTSGTFSALGGWRVFPEGALRDYQRTGNENSRQTVLRLAYNSAWAGSAGGSDCELSRETAYLVNAYIAAEKLGEPRNSLLGQAVAFALGHVDQWFVQRSCGNAPFMVGLTMEALINYYQLTSDPRVPPAIRIAADALWASEWLPSAASFIYTVDDRSAAPDLSLLIAPAYAWLWQITGDPKYQDEGDQIFAGGVLNAGFWTGKQFSQNYRSSFNYVKWRSAPAGSLPLSAF